MALPINKESILEKHCPSMSLLYLDDNGRAFRERILSAMEDHGDKLLHDESESAPSGEREGDAVAFNIYCTDNYYYENGFWWHKENHDPYSVDQLYDIFKQQKEG